MVFFAAISWHRKWRVEGTENMGQEEKGEGLKAQLSLSTWAGNSLRPPVGVCQL